MCTCIAIIFAIILLKIDDKLQKEWIENLKNKGGEVIKVTSQLDLDYWNDKL